MSPNTPPPLASSAVPTRRGTRCRRLSQWRLPCSRCMSVSGRRGFGRKITRTCSKGCTRPACRSNDRNPPPRRESRRGCGRIFRRRWFPVRQEEIAPLAISHDKLELLRLHVRIILLSPSCLTKRSKEFGNYPRRCKTRRPKFFLRLHRSAGSPCISTMTREKPFWKGRHTPTAANSHQMRRSPRSSAVRGDEASVYVARACRLGRNFSISRKTTACSATILQGNCRTADRVALQLPVYGTPRRMSPACELTLSRHPYKIYYEVTSDEVIILHVRHTRRRPPRRAK
jgi:plasmid stabilization system protein ParE